MSQAEEVQVRGAALLSLQQFILTRFQREGYQDWYAQLPPVAQQHFSTPPDPDGWYPLASALQTPLEVLCNLFYAGKPLGAWESGKFSADHGLNNMMKIFISVASVPFIVKRAARILSRYYQSCEAEVWKSGSHEAIIRITSFPGLTPLIENRIAGYMQRAAELTGGRSPQVFIGPSATKAHPYTEFKVQWK
jgi:hypothetical protein